MSSAVLKLLKMAVGMRALLDTVMQALPQVTHCHIKPELLWPTAHFLLQRNANHFIFAVIREAHFPPEALRYSPHTEVIFAPKQFKFWIKEYSKKQVWNKKINECSFFCVFSPHFFFSFQVGNLGLLFMLLFFIFAALGVELFGDLGESSRADGRGGNGVGVGVSQLCLVPQSVMTHTPARGWDGMPRSGTLV